MTNNNNTGSSILETFFSYSNGRESGELFDNLRRDRLDAHVVRVKVVHNEEDPFANHPETQYYGMTEERVDSQEAVRTVYRGMPGFWLDKLPETESLGWYVSWSAGSLAGEVSESRVFGGN